MDPVGALRDPDLLGALPAFRDLTTWRPWLAFLRAFYGLPMDATDLALFVRHTGRAAPAAGGYPEAVVITGCQSGKSQVASAVATYEAMQASVRGVRGIYVPLVAQDLRGAQRTLFGYVREAFDIPVLRKEVAHETANSIEMAGGVTIGVYPCRPAAIRGIRAAALVIDELAYFIATDGRPTDVEMLRAARSRLAMAPGGGRLLVFSSPYAATGQLFELHRRHYGRDESTTLCWQASAAAMNPTLPADYLDRMRDEDPEAYQSEVLGEFRAGLSALFDPAALEDCVASGRRELQRAGDVTYQAFADPSGGRADAFTVAIGHQVAGRAVVDVLRAWPAPFNPSGVVAEAAELLKGYGCDRVTGDRYGGEWPREAFRTHGLMYELATEDRSELYLAMLPIVNAKAIELPDLAELLRELRGLERRRGTAGRDRVDHPRGAHDDRANAVAGVLSLLRSAGDFASATIQPGVDLRADYGRNFSDEHRGRSRLLTFRRRAS